MIVQSCATEGYITECNIWFNLKVLVRTITITELKTEKTKYLRLLKRTDQKNSLIPPLRPTSVVKQDATMIDHNFKIHCDLCLKKKIWWNKKKKDAKQKRRGDLRQVRWVFSGKEKKKLKTKKKQLLERNLLLALEHLHHRCPPFWIHGFYLGLVGERKATEGKGQQCRGQES